MKRPFKNRIVKTIAVVLVASMVLVIADKIVFTHSHILADGRVISHSHPYDKTNDSEPFKSHHHTQAELFFFQHIEIFFPFVFFSLKLIYRPARENHFIYSERKATLVAINAQKCRAPPLLVI
jgi:uncharacterized membrane protein YwaF